MRLIDADALTKKMEIYLDACKKDNCISSGFEEGLDYALSEITAAPTVTLKNKGHVEVSKVF